MTPLAHRILANSLKPVKDRLPVNDEHGFLKDLASVTCFDVTAIVPILERQAQKMKSIQTPWPTAFLPAPRTWIELVQKDGARVALLLQSIGDKIDEFSIVAVGPGVKTMCGAVYLGQFDSATKRPKITYNSEWAGWESVTGQFLLLALSAINSPKVFARVEHDPHAGLARKLAASKAMPGKYPLHAWHEIKLEGWVPKVERGIRRAKGATGEKAEHFVRAHPRFQNGRWVEVIWHWRGNPELGMRRARYSVQMPKEIGT